MNIYVGNLSYDANEDELRRVFEDYGEITSVAIIKDKFSGRSRGFGFVEMADDSAAQTAIAELDGKEMMGRNLRVNQARPREDRGRRRGGGGGGGGYNRGGGGGRRNYNDYD